MNHAAEFLVNRAEAWKSQRGNISHNDAILVVKISRVVHRYVHIQNIQSEKGNLSKIFK